MANMFGLVTFAMCFSNCSYYVRSAAADKWT